MAIAGEFETDLETTEEAPKEEKKPRKKAAKKAPAKAKKKSEKKPAKTKAKKPTKKHTKTSKKPAKKSTKKIAKSPKTIATTSRSGKKMRRAVNGGKGKPQQGGRMALVVLVTPKLRAKAWKMCKSKDMYMTEFLTKAIEKACARG